MWALNAAKNCVPCGRAAICAILDLGQRDIVDAAPAREAHERFLCSVKMVLEDLLSVHAPGFS